MLQRVFERVSVAKKNASPAVLTSVSPQDDQVADFCTSRGIPFFRGNEEDVLDRYYQAAKHFQCGAVMRITADCPLIDPDVLDALIEKFSNLKPDYASNFLKRTYPRGLDAEIMTFECLERTWQKASEPYQRTHVTPYIYQNPDLFRLAGMTSETDYSAHRWTVDTPEDLSFIRAIYDRLSSEGLFSWRRVLSLIESEPSLTLINSAIHQKDLHEG